MKDTFQSVISEEACPVCGGMEWEILRIDHESLHVGNWYYLTYALVDIDLWESDDTALDRCLGCDTIFSC